MPEASVGRYADASYTLPAEPSGVPGPRVTAETRVCLSVPPPGDQDRFAGAGLAAVLHRYGARGEVAFDVTGADGHTRLARVDLTPVDWSQLADRFAAAPAEPPTGTPVRLILGDDLGEPASTVCFTVSWTDDAIIIRCAAPSDVANAADCERMAGHLCAALHSAITDRAACFTVGVALTAPERELIAALDRPRRPSADRTDLVSRYLAAGGRDSAAIAVRAGADQLTYGELTNRASAIATALAAAGVLPGDRVGLAAGRGLSQVCGVVGILMAGAAYVPVDPDYPAARRRAILDDARPRVLLADAGVETPSDVCPVVRLDEIAADGSAPPARRPSPDDVAYVIYTSGSTGTPKGVEVTHYNVVRLFDTTERDVRPGPADVWTMFHSYAFDFSVWELWGALLYGGRLVVVPFATSRNPHAFADLVRAEDVTVLNQTPSAFTQFVDAVRDLTGTSLRLVMLGGEAVHAPVLRQWFGCPGADAAVLINLYGITETTVHATWRPLTAADAAGSGSPIGVPLDDLGIRLADDLGRTPPVGVPGEILVTGDGVARGYLGAPELTAERFTTDDTGRRWYHSGDLAVLTTDGGMSYRGRRDRQVKVRGFRVELGDIEAALCEHPQVTDAVVITMSGPLGNAVLVGFAVAGTGVIETELKRLLRRRLPDHMVPAQIRVLPALPLTVNGKADVAALLATLEATTESAAEPETAAQRLIGNAAVLAEIWTQVLGVRPGPHDSFFYLGGDSLSVIEMLRRATEAGLGLELDDVFVGRTVAELTASNTAASTVGTEFTVEAVWAGLATAPPPAARVVTVRAGEGPPLVMVPWGTGSIAMLRELPEEFDAARPLAGIESVGMHDGHRPLTDMDEIARCAAAGVLATGARAVHLGGFCFGAAVALPVAQLLATDGVEVRSVMLVDAVPPDPEDPQLGWSLDDLLRFHVSMLRNDYGSDDADTLRRLAARGIVDEGEPADRLLPLNALLSANAYAQLHSKPEPYHGHVLLVASNKHRAVAVPSAWAQWLVPELVEHLVCDDAPDSRDLLTSPAFVREVPAYLARIDAGASG